MLHRRLLASVSLIALAVVVSAGAALANAPLVRGQAPGWYRMPLGDFEVTALLDGTIAMPIEKLLTNTTPEGIFGPLVEEVRDTVYKGLPSKK